MPTFILVRHAESPWSPDDRRPLSPAGQLAASELADRLAPVELEAIYSSPYRRAVQTVEPLAQRRGLTVIAAAELRECSFGDFGDLPFPDAARAAWQDFDISWPGGESAHQAQQRVVNFVETVAAMTVQRPIVLSTHGTLMTLLLNAFDRSVGYDFWLTLRHPDIFRFELRRAGDAEFRRL